MRLRRIARLGLFGVVSLAATSVLGGTTVATPETIVRIHPDAADAGGPSSSPMSTAECESKYKIDCYGPAQLRAAYDLPALYAKGTQGQGQTIAVVDSFGSPTIENDLKVFDDTYGLPAPPKFDVIQPAGTVPPYDGTDATRRGWAGETTLDVEWAHALAPKANILLVETPTAETLGTTGFPEIVTAEKYVIDHGLATVISQSFGASEATFAGKQDLLNLRSAYVDAQQHGITVLASSGDSGVADVGMDGQHPSLTPVVAWPSSDPLVTAVGGTRLHLDANGDRTSADTVWNDTYDKNAQQFVHAGNGPDPLATGGGLSAVFARPSYQDGVANVTGPRRGLPDVAMSAACSGAVEVYHSFDGSAAGWYATCGTSEAAPLFSAIVALAAQTAGHPLGQLNPALYALSDKGKSGLVDVTTGNNTASFSQDGIEHTVPGYPARTGYDLVSGVGTIDAAALVPALAKQTESR